MNAKEIIELVQQQFPEKGVKEIVTLMNNVLYDMHMDKGVKTDVKFVADGESYYYDLEDESTVNAVLTYRSVRIGSAYLARLTNTPGDA
jgi:hypothetical protein